jgi:hypothetical protein
LRFTYQVHIPATKDAQGKMLLWLPLPQQDTYQLDLHHYLEPDKLVLLNGIISDLAMQNTAGDTDPLAKARHIYDYVLATMR